MNQNAKDKFIQGLNNVKSRALQSEYFSNVKDIDILINEVNLEEIQFIVKIIAPVPVSTSNLNKTEDHTFKILQEYAPIDGDYYWKGNYCLIDNQPSTGFLSNTAEYKLNEFFNYFEEELTYEFKPQRYIDIYEDGLEVHIPQPLKPTDEELNKCLDKINWICDSSIYPRGYFCIYGNVLTGKLYIMEVDTCNSEVESYNIFERVLCLEMTGTKLNKERLLELFTYVQDDFFEQLKSSYWKNKYWKTKEDKLRIRQ